MAQLPIRICEFTIPIPLFGDLVQRVNIEPVPIARMRGVRCVIDDGWRVVRVWDPQREEDTGIPFNLCKRIVLENASAVKAPASETSGKSSAQAATATR